MAFGSFAQVEPNFGNDKEECLKYVSLYSGYLKQKAYKDAYQFWKEAARVCPKYKPVLYSNGVYILKKLSKDKSIDEATRKRYKDSIRVVYEAGIKIFGATPDILEDYGNDLILYAKDYAKGVESISEAIDGLRNETKYSTIMYYSSALKKLERKKLKTCEDLVKEYERLSVFIDANAGKKGYDKAQAAIDKNLGPCLTCDKLVPVLAKKEEEAKTNTELRTKILAQLKKRKCTDSELFETLLTIQVNENPTPTANDYLMLAELLLKKKKTNEALKYLDKALEVATDEEKEKVLKGAVSTASSAGKTSKSVKYANDLLKINPNSGVAYLAKANAAARSGCAVTKFESDAKNWAAYDLAAKAKKIDSSVAKRANKAMANYRARFPDSKELFAKGLKEGQSYNTCAGPGTVRAK